MIIGWGVKKNPFPEPKAFKKKTLQIPVIP